MKRWLVTSALCLNAIAATATAAPGGRGDSADGVFHATDVSTAPAAGHVEATQVDQRRWVVVGARTEKPTEVTVRSSANDNQHYVLFVRHASATPCGYAVVRLAGALFLSEGWGSSGEHECDGAFTLPAAAATLAARVFGVAREDRHPAGEAVAGAVTVVSGTGSGSTGVTVRVVLTNPKGAPRVWTTPPYPAQTAWPDPALAVQVLRDGRPVLPPATVAGGNVLLPVAVALAPGAQQVRVLDLSRYVPVGAPGHYEVRCTASIGFAPGTTDLGAIDDASWWTRTFVGSGSFDVR